MFLGLAIASTLGYALQGSLLVRFARNIDGLSLAFYRNLSLSITLLPLLLADLQGARSGLMHADILALAGLAGGLSLALQYGSFRSIPVGVSQSIRSVTMIAILMFLGWFMLGERIALPTGLLLAAIVAGSFFIGMRRTPLPHLDNRHAAGLALAMLSAAPTAMSIFLFVVMTEKAGPWAASYLWEASIALGALCVVLLRRMVLRRGLQQIDLRTGLRIALCASPTLVGTGCYALAYQLGGVAVTSAIGGTGVMFMTVFAWKMYGERLRTSQWIAIGLVAIGIVALQLVR